MVAVDGLEEVDHVSREVEKGRDQEGAGEEVDEKSALVEDADELGVVAFATDFVSESDVETGDEEVAEDEGEDGGDAHADGEEGAVATPPEVDDDDCVVEQFADGVGEDVAKDVSGLLLLRLR